MYNHTLNNLNALEFKSDSLKPTSSEIVEKLEKVISIHVSPLPLSPYFGGHQTPYPYPPSQGYWQQQQQQPQMQQPHRRMTVPPFGLQAAGVNTTKVVLLIASQKITMTFGDVSHFFIRNSKGEWEYTIEKSHYNESLSYYSSLLCDEIVANSK